MKGYVVAYYNDVECKRKAWKYKSDRIKIVFDDS